MIVLPRCGSEKVGWLEKTRVWKCYASTNRQPTFTLKTGTIFEDSPIALEKWLPAAWLVINCKNGIFSYEIARDLGVTQKSAWFMLHRVRLAMQDGSFDGKLRARSKPMKPSWVAKSRTCTWTSKRARKSGSARSEGKAIVAAVMGASERLAPA